MATMTEQNLREVRAEVGSSPSDDDLQDLWEALTGSVPAVALAVLRPRLADARAAAADGGFTISGALGTTAPAATVLAQLDAQIARLEGQLAAETGTVGSSGLAMTSVVAGRYDRPR
jgi:hypothetical protein